MRKSFRPEKLCLDSLPFLIECSLVLNSNSSDIVREARQQHMMRPKILKDAAAKHNLFLAEDGSVLEIFDEEQKPKKKRGKKDDGEENGKKEEAGSKKVRVIGKQLCFEFDSRIPNIVIL